MLTDQELLRIYLSIKKHFTSKTYDFSKDKFIHVKITSPPQREIGFLRTIYKKTKSRKAFVTFIVANFAYYNDGFIYKLDDIAWANYDTWVAYRNSHTYRTTQENEFISKVLVKNSMVFDQLFTKTDKNNLPPILTLYLSGKVSLQYICLLDSSKNFLTTWLGDSSITHMFEKELRRIQKTKFFLNTLEKQREITAI